MFPKNFGKGVIGHVFTRIQLVFFSFFSFKSSSNVFLRFLETTDRAYFCGTNTVAETSFRQTLFNPRTENAANLPLKTMRTFSLLAMLARHYGAAARTKRISRPYAPLVLCQYSLPYWSGERMTSFYPLWELFRNARARYEDPDREHICADHCISERKTFLLNEEMVNDRKIAGLEVQMFSVQCFVRYS